MFYCTEACNGDPTFNIEGAVPIIANYAKISNIAEKREIICNFMKELNGFNEKLLIVLFPYYLSDYSCYDFTFNIPETFPNIDISPSVYGYGGSGTEVDNFNEKQYSEEDQEYKPDIADEIEIEEYDQKDPIPMKSVTTVNNDKKDPTQATLNSKANFFKKSEFIEIKPPADTRNSDIKTSGEIESKLQADKDTKSVIFLVLIALMVVFITVLGVYFKFSKMKGRNKEASHYIRSVDKKSTTKAMD